jgi:hypothetical protein
MSALLASSNTWTANQTFVSSVTVSSAVLLGSAGYTVTISSNLSINNGGTFYQNGDVTIGTSGHAVTVSSNITLGGATSLTNIPALGAGQFVKTDGSKNLTSGTLAVGDMSALLASSNTWTANQTFVSSVTVSSAVLLGSAGYTVTISSNLSINNGGTFYQNGAVSLGTSGQAVTISSNVTLGGATSLTNIPALGASQFVKTDGSKNLTSGTLAVGDMSALLASSNTWTANQTFVSSVTVSSAVLLGSAGYTVTISSNLSINNGGTFYQGGAVTLGTSGKAVTISSNVTLGGATSLTNVPALTASQFVKTDGSKNLTSGTLAAGDMSALLASSNTWTGGNTYVSSTTFNGAVLVSTTVILQGSTGINGQVFTSGGPNAQAFWSTLTGASLTSTQTWTGGNTYVSSSTFNGTVVISTNVAMNNGTLTMTNSSIAISSGVLGSSIYQNGSSCNINWANGNTQYMSLGSNCNMNFSGGVSGRKYVLIINYTGSFAPVWNAAGTTVRFPGGVSPVLTSINGKTDYLAFMYNDVSAVFDNLAETLNY